MTRKEQTYLLDSIDEIRAEVHENNIMLRQIIKVINTYISRHHQENEDDFGRNVLANILSGMFDLSKFKRR